MNISIYTVKMERKITLVASILGIIAIVLGAFGAHALKKVLTPDALVSFETGVRYQLYHALFLLFVATTSLIDEAQKKQIFSMTRFGVLFFSGSIYILTTSALSGIDFAPIGWVTPLGGALLISAWITLFIGVYKKKTE
ncbi:MAG: hypothetical protein RLZ77_818 [Bacteroidota bacterium]